MNKDRLKLVAMWKRAWYGRVVHCFIKAEETLCGKELVPHKEYWEQVGYSSCGKCQKEYRKIMTENS